MLVNLIIDGNYLLSKTVFPLHKGKKLYGSLFNVLKKSLTDFRNNYPYSNVYFVSDSRNKSWRKNIYPAYKDNRKKDNKIDWDFCHRTYDEFKQYLRDNTRIKVLEGDEIEGDDWISYLVNKSNNSGVSTVVVTNDYDIKQMVNMSFEPLYINFIVNEMHSSRKIFLPEHYILFIKKLQDNISESNLFDINNDSHFLSLINNFINNCETHTVKPYETLILKMITGDKGDNIFSAWSRLKNGRRNGIGETIGAKIMDKFLDEYEMPNLNDNKVIEDLTDIILEMKKLDAYEFDSVVETLKLNKKIMSLDILDIPKYISDRMEYEVAEAEKNANNFDRMNMKEDPYANFSSDFTLVDETTEINETTEDDKDFFNFL